jgi:hypothetical protein
LDSDSSSRGALLTDGPEHGGAAWNYVTSRFFDVFKIPIKRGRTFTEGDDASAPRVVIINEAMAKRYWKNADPIGQRLVIGSGMGPDFVQAPANVDLVGADALAFLSAVSFLRERLGRSYTHEAEGQTPARPLF